MPRKWLLGLASLLVVASVGALQAAPPVPPKAIKAPTAPTAPRAPQAPKAPVAPTAPGASGPVINQATTKYDVKGIEVDDVFGTLHITVTNGGPVTLSISGTKPALDNLHVSNMGDRLLIKEEHEGHVWNWREWFTYKRERRDRITLNITAPKGTSLGTDGFVGDLTVGDLDGPVKIEAAAAQGTIGNVTSATLSLAGSGKLSVGAVTQQLKIEIAGSGTINAGASAGASIEIAGSGDAHVGPVLGKLRVEIAGSGDVTVASVNGPTTAEIAGAGSIKIDTGEANPLKVEILGSGDFDFGGEAVDPEITAMGSGDVTLKSYRGKLDTDGMAHLKIGSKE